MALIEYGSKGLMGVLTPQANTTVEPELWALMPAHMSIINARLTSDKDTIEARLIDYTKRFESTATQFANAPISVIAAACTGASYLIGAEAEAKIVTQMERSYGVPFITAALASVAALRVMNACKIALLSPYPDSLNTACKPYWESFGFEVIAKAGPKLETDAFHPIYAMTDGGVYRAYEQLSDSGADAVLMLGTGMATLRPLLAGHEQGLMPAISCNLALVWAAAQARHWADLEDMHLAGWRTGLAWSERLNVLFPKK
ncbi:hypothetical protein OAC59_10485 [Planktomarina temperata]|jgi:maleate cis-trans isomerase|uniref:maleate cis-trans isomerase family protein n=1 Tax=Pacificibacter sp. TaxID=1917866 RepID=UPI002372FD38|nr:hypothetical protein [Gammaproteobacteria bacterium]MCO4849234.1 hypothetical protein [Yoonia sp.]MDB9834168.1 hypothetical protein [Planktomarina temperata]MDC1016633.1 hypothetical protein [Planktomarina temperata]